MMQDAALRCTQGTQRNIEIDTILAFATQRNASATEGVHKLKRNATQRLASYCRLVHNMTQDVAFVACNATQHLASYCEPPHCACIASRSNK